MPILQALIYTVYRCGFYPQTSLDEDDASEFRLNKITRLIEGCRYGIHDISRTELSAGGYPRFNMPFELGVFYGAKRFGEKDQKRKNALIFEKVRYSYNHYISDLNGVDTKAHTNDPNIAIRRVRDWLSISSRRSNIPGHLVVQQEYEVFKTKLPAIVQALGFDINDIPFNDFCKIVEDWVNHKSAPGTP